LDEALEIQLALEKKLYFENASSLKKSKRISLVTEMKKNHFEFKKSGKFSSV